MYFLTLGEKQSSQGKKIVLITKDGVYYRSARRKMDLQQPRLNLYANLFQSVSRRHSLRFRETNIHLLLMALMHALQYKNSSASHAGKSSWDGHKEEDTWDEFSNIDWSAFLWFKCIYVWSCHKGAFIHSWLCCESAEESVRGYNVVTSQPWRMEGQV